MRRLFLLAENIVAFTWVDWAIIAVIAVSSLISLKRGFVKEALSLLTWIIAGVVAWMFGGALSHHLAEYISTPSAQVIAACALLFVATLLVGALVNFLIGELIRVTGLSGTDRFLGMVFGAARGGLLIADSANCRIVRIADMTGSEWRALGRAGRGFGELDHPSHVSHQKGITPCRPR